VNPEILTQPYLKKILDYAPDTGVFVWKIAKSKNIRVGAVAGCINSLGYRVIKIDRRTYLAHRLAWLYVYGEFPDNQIDHINQAKDDNRILNLRDVTVSENGKNAKMSKNNTSGINGVCWYKRRKKWRVRINVNGKLKHLGYYEDLKLAALVRKEAEIKYGYHKNHGKPAKCPI